MLNITPAWRTAYPGACAGLLVMQAVRNPAAHPELETLKQSLEQDLRGKFAGQDRAALDALPAIQAYAAYYKQFKKTYHVRAQLESIVFKDRSIPSVAALVEAMFMAELKNMLLTAGHDFDRLELPLTLSVAGGSERYMLLRGQEETLKPGDMFVADRAGVVSSIIYGPDQRTQITSQTTDVLFFVYAPAGIDEQAVHAHLGDIRDYISIFAPGASVRTLQVVGAGRAESASGLQLP